MKLSKRGSVTAEFRDTYFQSRQTNLQEIPRCRGACTDARCIAKPLREANSPVEISITRFHDNASHSAGSPFTNSMLLPTQASDFSGGSRPLLRSPNPIIFPRSSRLPCLPYPWQLLTKNAKWSFDPGQSPLQQAILRYLPEFLEHYAVPKTPLVASVVTDNCHTSQQRAPDSRQRKPSITPSFLSSLSSPAASTPFLQKPSAQVDT